MSRESLVQAIVLLLVCSVRCYGGVLPPSDLQPGDRWYRVFSTSFNTTVFDNQDVRPSLGQFGSIEQADWTGSYAAFAAGLLTNWNFYDTPFKTFLSDDRIDAKDRFEGEAKLFNMRNELVAESFGEFLLGRLNNAIRYNEFGQFNSRFPAYWSGTNLGGTHSGQSAGNWSGQPATATIGSLIHTDGRAIDIGTTSYYAKLLVFSPIYTVPGGSTGVVPEPTSMAVFSLLGAVSCFSLRARRRC